ncbi:MAG TPA: PSD1 and planctomycete cytochrome C domain-containing protein [Isosphaeraceae bacterium]|nr:PSD1 and planctomycete cytochrome C domain-containing protein [Isosphaeraceae bacterium]
MQLTASKPDRCICCLAIALTGFISIDPVEPKEMLIFEKDVRPILKAYCLDCHGGGDALKGHLDLRLKRFAERGGDSGPALVAGHPEESLLIERLKNGEMPPGEKKVPPEQIALIERWIAAGAVAKRNEPERLDPGIDMTPEERAYWAFQPIRRLAPPTAGPSDRVRTPIDAFVLAKLRERGLSLAPDTDKRTLIRRAAFDLTGLPPSQEEIDAFVADSVDGAYERMLDQLMASPRYGERWARHWLDVTGYADSDGNGTEDSIRPYAYKYRDYVVRSMNADKPLDQFIVEQLAGDELVPRPWNELSREKAELLAATGFLRTAPDGTSTGASDEPLAANQVVADTLKIVGSTLLGMTVGCAQCHDHRYDPIPQADYYRLRAIFEPALDTNHWRRPAQRLVSLFKEADRARCNAIEAEAAKLEKIVAAKTKTYMEAAIKKELAKFPEALRSKLRAALDVAPASRSDEQRRLLASNPSVNITEGVLYQYDPAAAEDLKKETGKVAAKRAEKPIEDFVSVLDEVPGVLPTTKIFHRGDHRQPTKTVRPGDLSIAAPEGKRYEAPEKDAALPTSGRRLAYARHLVTGDHPLVARVLVNRIWLSHFGRGLVDTPGDFGVLGMRPTHPELLDWLADQLVRQGWSLKRMHKLIMTSTVYRQSSRGTQSGSALDSSNTLYSHFPLRRLEAEEIRDVILHLSGRLAITLYGPPVPVAEDTVGHILPDKDSARRSLYLQSRRTKPVSLLATFDFPTMAVNCDRRATSTSATQSLVLMNSEFVLSHAGHVARRVRQLTSAGSASDQLAREATCAWKLVYQRAITPEERAWVNEYVSRQLSTSGPDRELAVLTNLCQQLLISNEFLYVD